MSVEDDHKLFVAGLAEAATEDGLRGLFEAAGGSVSEITVPRDRATGRPRGFAFVTMASEDDARVVRQQLDGSLYEGRPLSVRPFRADRGGTAPGAARPTGTSSERRYEPRGEGGFAPRAEGRFEPRGEGRPEPRGDRDARGSDYQGRSPAPPRVQQTGGAGGPADDSTLYVGNLPFDCTSQELERMFAERGFETVRRVHLPMDPEGRARGFGFVSLDSPDTARRAVEQLHDAAVRGRRLSISVARARGTGGPGPGTSGQHQRPSVPPPGRGPGPRPSSSGSFAAPPHHGPPKYDAPQFSPDAPPPAPTDEEGRRGAKWDKDKKKEKKRKTKSTPAPERGAKRRRDDGFRSTRAQDYVDDWDDD
ncbi:MAG TPA: RNA-binding protein [Polyangiaceae bacterium]|jgi:RNA recognition motif-containing protein|nr:RNA-binding protein [Polyangiaceae bacterium]